MDPWIITLLAKIAEYSGGKALDRVLHRAQSEKREREIRNMLANNEIEESLIPKPLLDRLRNADDSEIGVFCAICNVAGNTASYRRTVGDYEIRVQAPDVLGTLGTRPEVLSAIIRQLESKAVIRREDGMIVERSTMSGIALYVDRSAVDLVMGVRERRNSK